MLVTVISDTIQEFDGKRYYRCGPYFQRKGKRLHRVVWESQNGQVPHGFHVHHLDHNTANNRPNNLALLRDAAHLSHHSSLPTNKAAASKRMQEIVRPKADEWHRSDAGRQWHRQHGKDAWQLREPVQKTCEVCGKTYETFFPSRSRFCHQNCKAVALRRRRAASRKNHESSLD